MIVLRSAGVEVAGARFDTMVASYLLDAGERNHNLDELAQRYLRHDTTKIDELIGSGQEPEADGRGAAGRRSRTTRPKTPTWPGGCGRSWPSG